MHANWPRPFPHLSLLEFTELVIQMSARDASAQFDRQASVHKTGILYPAMGIAGMKTCIGGSLTQNSMMRLDLPIIHIYINELKLLE